MKYCTNCGTKLEKNSRFCSRCGKPCTKGKPAAKNNKTSAAPPAPVRIKQSVSQRSFSGGFGRFFAGTLVGAFLGHIFSGSHSTPAYSGRPVRDYYHDPDGRYTDYDDDSEHEYVDEDENLETTDGNAYKECNMPPSIFFYNVAPVRLIQMNENSIRWETLKIRPSETVYLREPYFYAIFDGGGAGV